MSVYYTDTAVTLHLGDCLEILPDLTADVCITDPPYGETSLEWDRWPDGWPFAILMALPSSSSLWCFGSMRMFLERRAEFRDWTYAQEIVWEKQDGSGFTTDRFRRVHEFATHWYRGPWGDTTHNVPRVGYRGPDKSVTRAPVDKNQHGVRGPSSYVDDGTRLTRSVLRISNMHGRAVHPTEKPPGILEPLIRYSTKPGDTILDPFAGSGSSGVTAKALGRKAVLIEADEAYAEIAARRLSQGVLDFGEVS
jgi:site-specific DNA-methyltransferase (adenine-specific)